jgi:predicted DNA-binding ribbon-helix-helix protein
MGQFLAQDHLAPTEARSSDLRTTLINRNVTVAGHRTSIRLEPLMWAALRQICNREQATINEIVTAIDRKREESSLTAAIRVYLLCYFQAAATDEGHNHAGHGGVPLHYGA